MTIIYGRKFGKLQPTRGFSHLALLSDTLLSPHKVCCLFSYPFHNSIQAVGFFLSKASCQLYLVSTVCQTLSLAFCCRKFKCGFTTLEVKRAALGRGDSTWIKMAANYR